MHTNRLSKETSPYLLQHAHNPVDWYPWGAEALEKARTENKLLLVSIGYSACHWCHVMEKECFEDADVAQVMNAFFVNIKVDREERPDIDHMFMDAVQIMTGQGGWPLNAFALPNGNPIYAGTYFPKPNWIKLCNNINNLWQTNPSNAHEYAHKLKESLVEMNAVQGHKLQPNEAFLTQVYNSIAARFDSQNGGVGNAPKFPMPSIYEFLLTYHFYTGNKMALDQALFTLDKMAMGGIYDQLGGGFARYATDAAWKIPHFEKMLYDNAQLIGLYSRAYLYGKDPFYQKIVYETIDFCVEEWRSPQGAFYAALDADSEGVEGKFYVWTKAEIEEVLQENAPYFIAHFEVEALGKWEHNNNILIMNSSLDETAHKFGLSTQDLVEKLMQGRETLFAHRNKRVKPGLDNKILTAWNALMISGLAKAARIFGEQHFFNLAESALNFIFDHLFVDGKLHRTVKNNTAAIPAFAEDYALLIQALLDMYAVNYNPGLLELANHMTQETIALFYDTSKSMFYFTSAEQTDVLVRKIEVQDNVVSSCNAIMAHNLFALGKLNGNTKYVSMATNMLANVSAALEKYGSWHAHWAQLYAKMSFPFYEVAIVGPQAASLAADLSETDLPNAVIASSEVSSNAPLFKNRFTGNSTHIYICQDHTCTTPFTQVEAALQYLAPPT